MTSRLVDIAIDPRERAFYNVRTYEGDARVEDEFLRQTLERTLPEQEPEIVVFFNGVQRVVFPVSMVTINRQGFHFFSNLSLFIDAIDWRGDKEEDRAGKWYGALDAFASTKDVNFRHLTGGSDLDDNFVNLNNIRPVITHWCVWVNRNSGEAPSMVRVSREALYPFESECLLKATGTNRYEYGHSTPPTSQINDSPPQTDDSSFLSELLAPRHPPPSEPLSILDLIDLTSSIPDTTTTTLPPHSPSPIPEIASLSPPEIASLSSPEITTTTTTETRPEYTITTETTIREPLTYRRRREPEPEPISGLEPPNRRRRIESPPPPLPRIPLTLRRRREPEPIPELEPPNRRRRIEPPPPPLTSRRRNIVRTRSGRVVKKPRRYGSFLAMKWSREALPAVKIEFSTLDWEEEYQWYFDVERLKDRKDVQHCLPYALEKSGVPHEVVVKCCEAEIMEWKRRTIQPVAKRLYKYNFYIEIAEIGARGNNVKTTPALSTGTYPFKEEDNMVRIKICFYKNHWFKYDELQVPLVIRTVIRGEYKKSNILILHQLVKKGQLEDMNTLDVLEVVGKVNKVAKFKNSFFMDNAEVFVESGAKEIFDDKSNTSLFQSGDLDEIIDSCLFFDSEATTSGEHHECYLISCWSRKHGAWSSDFERIGEETPGEQFFKYAATLPDIKIIYAHNLWYDFSHIVDAEGGVVVKTIMKGRITYEVQYFINNKLFILRDTLPILQCSLKKAGQTYLPKELQKSIRKEVFPYGFYDRILLDGARPAVEDAVQELSEEQKQEFCKNISELGLVDGDEFDFKGYARFYCEQDCRVLGMVWIEFIKLFLGQSDGEIRGEVPFRFNLAEFRTASSISYSYVQFSSMTDDVFHYSGALRRFIQNSIVGGRVMLRDNKAIMFKGDLDKGRYLLDLDAVSLYPTAMSKLWLPTGKPHVIRERIDAAKFKELFSRPEDDDSNEKELFSSGVLHITAIRVRKDRHFPIYSIKEGSTRDWINIDKDGLDIVVNAIDLWNLIDFQDADFVADFALGWKGKDFRVRESIAKLFNLRKTNKQHPIQLIFKMMMNSCYGKSVIKPIDTSVEILPNEEAVCYIPGKTKPVRRARDNFISNHPNDVLSAAPYGETHSAVRYKVDDDAFSVNIFGSDILAMARRIVGRVMTIIEDIEERDNSVYLYYTDTDSMHVDARVLEKLCDEFKSIYGTELQGSDMGCFHNDFDVPGEAIGAVESYFLAKKIYADKVAYRDGDGEIKYHYHYRMKGIPSSLIDDFSLYKRLFDGDEITFDLAKARPSFKKVNGNIVTVTKMERRIKINKQ